MPTRFNALCHAFVFFCVHLVDGLTVEGKHVNLMLADLFAQR